MKWLRRGKTDSIPDVHGMHEVLRIPIQRHEQAWHRSGTTMRPSQSFKCGKHRCIGLMQATKAAVKNMPVGSMKSSMLLNDFRHERATICESSMNQERAVTDSTYEIATALVVLWVAFGWVVVLLS